MESSREEEELRTIGMPRGAARELIKGLNLPIRRDEQPHTLESAQSQPAIVAPGAARPSAAKFGANGPGSLPADSGVEIDPNLLRTIPPPGPGRPARGISLLGARKPPEKPVPEPAEGRRKDGPSAQERRPAGGPAKPDRRRDAPPPSSDDNWPEGSDFHTAPLPGQYAASKPTALPDPSSEAEADYDELSESSKPSRGFARENEPPRRQTPQAQQSEPDTNTPSQFPESDLWGEFAEAKPAPRVEPDEELDLDNDSRKTIGWPRPSILVPKSILEFYDPKVGKWFDLGEVRRHGQVLGRHTFANWDSNPEGLAEEHVKISYENDELNLEPLPTLNGVYRKLRPNQRIELAPNTRFRIGRHVLTYRPAGALPEIAPKRSDEGEIFQSRVLNPLGFIDLIGPDGRPYLSFPMTRADEPGTRIGRAGCECDIALTGDDWTSSRHARLLFIDAKCLLEDLNSTNGTFVILNERIPLRRGFTKSPDSVDVILMGEYLIRVVELKPAAAAVEAINTRVRR
jgi:pSer/pThr/pTyr-binding forkhead associated (FHA) protein